MRFARQLKRGKRSLLLNAATGRLDHYRLTKRGNWVPTHPFSNNDIQGAQPTDKRYMNILKSA